MNNLDNIRRLVGEITAEDLKYVDFTMWNTFRSPSGKRQINHYARKPFMILRECNNNRSLFISLCFFLLASAAKPSAQLPVTITPDILNYKLIPAQAFLKNGEIIVGSGYFYPHNSTRKPCKIFILDGRKIKTDETDSLVIRSVPGYPDSLGWRFKLIDGTIKAYWYDPLFTSNNPDLIKFGDAPPTDFSKKFLPPLTKELSIKKASVRRKAHKAVKQLLFSYNEHCDPGFSRTAYPKIMYNTIIPVNCTTYRQGFQSTGFAYSFRSRTAKQLQEEYKDHQDMAALINFFSVASLVTVGTGVFVKAPPAVDPARQINRLLPAERIAYFSQTPNYNKAAALYIEPSNWVLSSSHSDWYLDGQFINPSTTDSIKINCQSGYPINNQWYFRNISGKISLYSSAPYPYPDTFELIQDGPSAPVPFSRKRLLKMIRNNTNTEALLNDTTASVWFLIRHLVETYNRSYECPNEKEDHINQSSSQTLNYPMVGSESASAPLNDTTTVQNNNTCIPDTNAITFRTLGDFYLNKLKYDSAAIYYTNALRYSFRGTYTRHYPNALISAKLFDRRIRRKIEHIGETPTY